MISILAHRGVWRQAEEQNGLAALLRCAGEGFGLETDLLAGAGEAEIAHDPAHRGGPALAELLQGLRAAAFSHPLALNIKADGLLPFLQPLLAESGLDYFCFDMSVPEMRRYGEAGMPFFTRVSDIEPMPVLLEQAQGLWVDGFARDWQDADRLNAWRAAGKRLCFVSPELHGRPYRGWWRWLKECAEKNLAHEAKPGKNEWMLCTDFPHEAREFFR